MTDTTTKETEEVVAAPTSAHDEVERPTADGLDADLAEFDAKTAQTPEVEATSENVDSLLSDQKAPVDPYDRVAMLRANMESQAQARAGLLDQQLSAMQQREYERQEDADFAEFSKATQEKLSEYLLPPDFARRFLMAEALEDRLFAECWLARNDPSLDSNTMLQVRRYLVDVQDRVVKAAASIPDREATADYEMVAQAVRNTGGRAPPAEHPPDLGSMKDHELRKHVREKYGYEMGI